MRLDVLALTLASALACGAVKAAPPESCRMMELGELAMGEDQGRPTIEASINGKPVTLLVDTGSEATLLSREGAAKLGLALRPLNTVKFYGVGGGDEAFMAGVNEFRLAGLSARGIDLVVSGRNGFGHAQGVLGAGFLLQADVEFDFPSRRIRFFKTENCQGDQVVYWGKAYAAAPMVANNGRKLQVMALLNGVSVKAELDTGAGGSVVTTAGAKMAGVKLPASGGPASRQVSGIGDAPVKSWRATFAAFGFGEETIRNPTLEIADLFGADTEVHVGSKIPMKVVDGPQMLLGDDFFRSHRIYVARAQKKVYVSYQGGPVFQIPPAGSLPLPGP